jgi:hypothetical protein
MRQFVAAALVGREADGAVAASSEKAENMLFALKDIQANPFRKIERYPTREDKIEALKESIQATEFWNNLVARVVNGKAQIAYGHHRLEALRRLYPPAHKVDLIVRDLSDEMMLKIMTRENMEEWGTSAIVEQETIRAWVEAYAQGIVHVPPIASNTPKSQWRYAPSFLLGQELSGAHHSVPYTSASLKQSTGWTDHSKIKEVLMALELIEQGILKEKDFAQLGRHQAAAVAEQSHRVQREQEILAKESDKRAQQAEREAQAATTPQQRRYHEKVAEHHRHQAAEARAEAKEQASHVGKTISDKIRNQEITSKGAFYEAEKAVDKSKRTLPDIDRFAQHIRHYLNSILDPHLEKNQWTAKINALTKHIAYLDEERYHEILQALHDLHIRIRECEKKMRAKRNPGNGQARPKGPKQLTLQ